MDLARPGKAKGIYYGNIVEDTGLGRLVASGTMPTGGSHGIQVRDVP